MSKLNDLLENTLISHLGIEITELSAEKVVGKMPVDHRTIQPAGILHGGASVTFAETLGSLGGNACINYPEQVAVGLEINANHVRSVQQGWVYGTAKPLHRGVKTQIWEVRIVNDEDKLVCVSRLTLAVLDPQHQQSQQNQH